MLYNSATIMNWTGGALGRSRLVKTSLSAIQKKHFAKARARLSSKQVLELNPLNETQFAQCHANDTYERTERKQRSLDEKYRDLS